MNTTYSFRHWVLIAMLLIVYVTSLSAQEKKHPPFDPDQFQIDLEQYITTCAGLTPGEASKFFPVYRQMMKKQRMVFDEMRRNQQVDTRDNKACARAIKNQDELDIELKLLQQEYHSRFMTMLPAGKVMKIIKAEEQFHRDAFKRMQARPPKKKQ